MKIFAEAQFGCHVIYDSRSISFLGGGFQSCDARYKVIKAHSNQARQLFPYKPNLNTYSVRTCIWKGNMHGSRRLMER